MTNHQNNQDDKDRELWISKALAVHEKIPGNRSYALDDVGAQSLGALACAWHERYVATQENDGKSTSFSLEAIVPTFQQLTVFVPEMLQLRPPPEPSAPTVWTDPISAQAARNPWSDPKDLTSQSVVATHDPQLAEHLKAIAEGVSYSFLAKRRDEEKGRAKLRDLVYGEAEHKRNPYVRSAGRKLNLTAAGEFEKTHPPEVVAFFRREGETDMRLPWRPKNITRLAQIGKHNPALRAIVTRAEEIENGWVQRELERLQETERSIAARRNAEELLR